MKQGLDQQMSCGDKGGGSGLGKQFKGGKYVKKNRYLSAQAVSAQTLAAGFVKHGYAVKMGTRNAKKTQRVPASRVVKLPWAALPMQRRSVISLCSP